MTDEIFKWTERPNDASRVQYIQVVKEDTLDEYFTTGGVYKGQEAAPQEPTITAKGAQELYGYTKDTGESEEDFLARISDPNDPENVNTRYSVVWEAGLYHKLTDDQGNPREITPGAQGASLQGRVAGKHYYRIVDEKTGSVICYKHEVVITQDTLELSNVAEPTSPLFVWENIKYGATWKGAVSSDRFNIPTKTVKVESFMTSEGKSFGNSQFLTSTKTLTLQDLALSASDRELAVNNFTNPNDTALAAVVDYTFMATAYSNVNGGASTYYGTIVQALDATQKGATSGTQVVAIPSFTCNGKNYYAGSQGDGTHYSHEITKDCVVGSNVTFRISNGIADNTTAYDKSSGHTGLFYVLGGSKSDDTAYYNKAYDVNVVTIAKSKKLENNGTIIIDAVVSGGTQGAPCSSIVSGPYGRLTLDSGAQLINGKTSSKINCYGFIDEVSENNGSLVSVEYGAVLGILSVVEHRGGGTFMGMVNPTSEAIQNATTLEVAIAGVIQKGTPYSPTLTTFPFHRFFVQSVSAKMKITASGSYRAVANLYANGSQNETTVDFIGGASSFIFGVSGSSYVENKFKHNQDATERGHDIDVYGSASFNPMTLSLTTQKEALGGAAKGTIVVNLKTSGTLFPISHYFDINFKKNGNASATVTMTGQDVKILPGGKLTIDPGVTVNAGKIAVYKDNSMLNGDSSYAIPDGKTRFPIQQALDYPAKFNDVGGELTVNGTLNAASIGGAVKSTAANAKIKVSSAAAVVSPELMTTYKETMTISIMGYSLDQDYYAAVFSGDAESTIKSSNLIYTGSTPESGQPFAVGAEYVSTKYGSNYAWFDSNITMTYDLCYTENNVAQVVVQNVTATGDGGIGAFYKPSRSGYIFEGWYTDAKYTTKVTDPSTIKYGTTLYARWEEVPTYTIVYDANYPDDVTNSIRDAKFSGGSSEAPEGAFTDVHNSCTWNSDYARPYYFVGWSTTPDGAVENSFTVTTDGLTLYAVWVQKVQLTINYNCGTGTGQNTVLGYTNEVVWVEHGKSYTITKDVSAGDYIMTNPWYFAQWIVNGCTLSDTVATVSSDTSVTAASITADWGAKRQITVTHQVDGGSSSFTLKATMGDTKSYTTTGTYYLKEGQSMTINASGKNGGIRNWYIRIFFNGSSSAAASSYASFWRECSTSATYTAGASDGSIKIAYQD